MSPPSAKVAARLAYKLYANRDKIMSGARTIRTGAKNVRNTYNKKRKYRAGSVLEGAKSLTPKIQQWLDGNGTGDAQERYMSRKNLFSDMVLFGRRSAPLGQLGEIQGNKVFVKGFKVCAHFRNTTPHTVSNQYYMRNVRVHFAILQAKCENTLTNGVEIPKENFFSDASNASDRYRDYVSNGAFDPRDDCQAINTTKWNVMQHTKFVLGVPNVAGALPCEKHIEKYFALNKTFEFEKSTDLAVTKPVFIAVWYDFTWPVTAEDDEALGLTINTTSFFNAVL